MRRTIISLIIVSSAVTVLGAACSSKKTSTTNTNPTNISTNTATVSNSSTTGTFTTGQNSNASVQTTTVTITAAGFQSASLIVTVGTTVTFQNNDSTAHQVASNPHPSHTGLPGFDSLTGIQPGQSYSYTFVKAGTWGYHDHLNPSLGGSVKVQ